MDEIEHLLAELEAADLDSPGQDFSRASKTKGMLKAENRMESNAHVKLQKVLRCACSRRP